MQNLIVYQFTALRWSVSQISNALELYTKHHVTDVHKQNHPKLQKTVPLQFIIFSK